MSTSFPCPNPTCGQVFAPDAIRGAASLKCPQCGTVFQFRSSAPPPATRPAARVKGPATPFPPPRSAVPPLPPGRQANPPAPPALAATPPPLPSLPPLPLALPAPADNVPLDIPEEEGPAPGTLDFDSGPRVAGTSARRKGKRRPHSNLPARIITVLVLAALLGGGVWAAIWVAGYVKKSEQATPVEVPGIKDAEKSNYKYVLPGGSWKLNPEVTAKLAVNFCLSQKQPSNNMALFCRDYVRRLPSEAEMLDTALTKLRVFFKSVEWERKSGSSQKLGQQPVAIHLEFQGVDPNGVPTDGEVLVLGYHGFGYWLFSWCPTDQRETLQAEWSKLRDNFSLLNRRDGWKETPRPRDTIAIAGLPYEIAFVKEVWKPDSADKWDPKAILVLLGFDPTGARHAGKAANFRLVALEKAAGVKDAFDSAQKYFTEKEKEEYPETIVTPLKNKDKDQISLTDLGDERGYLGKFEVRNTEERVRYVVVAAIQAPASTVMLLCDADFARKDFWDPEFAELLRSLRKK